MPWVLGYLQYNNRYGPICGHTVQGAKVSAVTFTSTSAILYIYGILDPLTRVPQPCTTTVDYTIKVLRS
jgi:hypothetical protein